MSAGKIFCLSCIVFYRGGLTMSLIKSLSNAFELPPIVLPKVPRVIMEADQCVRVENYGGVNLYAPEKIELRTALGPLTICGRNLVISRMNPQRVVLEGEIQSLQYGGQTCG